MALPGLLNKNNVTMGVERLRILYGVLVVIFVIFGLRLFYVQIIRYNHYKNAALSDQLKQYEIPAKRGIIEAHDSNGQPLPIVLNQQLYLLYADPTYVKHPDEVAQKVASVVGGDSVAYEKLMKTKDTRYVVLAKKLTEDQKKKITKLKYPGLGTQAVEYRTYPQGTLASQVLGFVNNDGKGLYGVEQALDGQLKGRPGQLRAITDINGVPLAASKENTERAPEDGKNIVLTLDLAMQQQLENILAKGVKNAKAPSGSAMIMDVNTGAIKAMANVPTFDPAKYGDVDDPTVFQNAAVAAPIEIGSTMKTLTTAAALDQGVIGPDTTYDDPAFFKVDGFKITNIEEDGGPGRKSIKDLLNLSLNTGATWELMQMGGGDINTKARNTWYDYMTKHYMFGKATGVEQGYEADGLVPAPKDNGAGINLTYANTSFGQAMTATTVQVAGALAATFNGGTYYQPRLVDETIDASGTVTHVKPKIIKKDVVDPKVTQDLIPIMQYVVEKHNLNFDQTNYMVGGKTGTAQIAKKGGYEEHLFNGTYSGFVGGDSPEYVIVVFINKPTNGGYAGTAAAQPVFADLAHMLIDNSYVKPRN